MNLRKLLNENDEQVLLEDISKIINKIEKKEVINKDKINKLPERVRSKDKKRRWRTHFTQSKGKKKRRDLIHKRAMK